MYNRFELLWENSMKILIDVYGGDYSPDEIVKGAIISVKEIADLEHISINTALGRMRYALINMRKNAQKYDLVRDLEKIFDGGIRIKKKKKGYQKG